MQTRVERILHAAMMEFVTPSVRMRRIMSVVFMVCSIRAVPEMRLHLCVVSCVVRAAYRVPAPFFQQQINYSGFFDVKIKRNFGMLVLIASKFIAF